MSPPLGSRHIKHVGTRPRGDQDNKFREKLCHIVKDVGCFYELCPEKLYLVYLAKNEDIDNFFEQIDIDRSPFIFWSARENPCLHYEAFSMDFGPFNLAVTHQFCSRLKVWLDTQQYRNPDKHIVIVVDDADVDRKLNITLLTGIASMVLLNLTDDEVIQRLNFFMMYNGKPGESSKQLIFREKSKFSDVSGNHSLMTVTLEDCIRAFYAAFKLKFYDYYEFDHIEYLFYETVQSGDLNWIVPGKLLAFAGPCDCPFMARHPPEFYYHYFKEHNVTTIVRLNEPEYRKDVFEKLGFDHHDLIFPDGYPPTSSIAAKFIKIVDEAKGGVAIHCYAGIGRTGTLIAAYLIARYNFTPQMAVAWTRICRPGSVIGEQQDWLLTKFDKYTSAALSMGTPKPNKARKTKIKDDADTSRNEDAQLSGDDSSKCTTYAEAERTLGQARALVLTKKHRELTARERPMTRNHDKFLKRQSLEQDSLTTETLSQTKEAKRTTDDFVIDLGKTVPWSMYDDDLTSLKGKKNPEFYRLSDGKYEWKVKFPTSDYVQLKHNWTYTRDGLDDSLMEIDEIAPRKIALDFVYRPLQANQSKNSGPKGKSKTSVSSVSGIQVSRLSPVVVYTLYRTSSIKI